MTINIINNDNERAALTRTTANTEAKHTKHFQFLHQAQYNELCWSVNSVYTYTEASSDTFNIYLKIWKQY